MKTIIRRLMKAIITMSAFALFIILLSLSFNASADSNSPYLVDAAAGGEYDKVTKLLKNGASPNSEYQGTTAIMWAAQNGHSKVVELLIKEGADVNKRDSNYGMTALMVSAAEGHTEVVRLLLDAKADVNVKDNNLGATALLGAAEYGYAEIIKALIAKGADVNARSKLNRTALMVSAVNGHTSTVQALLSAGADVNGKDSKYGATALMGAATNGHVDIVKALIEKGAKLNERNNNGMTALEMAKSKGQTKVVQILENAISQGRR